MAHNKVNMSLDEIIKENHGYRGARNMRGTRGRGRGGRAARGNRRAPSVGRNRSRSNSRSRSANRGSNVRSQSANRRGFLRNTAPRGGIKTIRGAVRGRGRGIGIGRGIVRGQRGGTIRGRLSRRDTIPIAQNGGRRSRSTSRGRFQNNNNNNNVGNNRSRSRSQSRNRMSRSRSRSRTRFNNQPQVLTTRGRGRGGNFRQTLIQRGGLTTRQNAPQNRIGLRSDLIARAQRRDNLNNKLSRAQNARGGIRSQTFTRSSESNTGLTVSVANEFALRANPGQQQILASANNRRPLRRRRKSSSGGIGYLDSRSLAQLAAALGGPLPRRKGPGSVNSNRSRHSAQSNRSGRSSMKRVLNPRLQKEIATIQGRVFEGGSAPSSGQPQPGINFTPTPHLTATSLSDRFSSM